MHVTPATLSARTQVYNIKTLDIALPAEWRSPSAMFETSMKRFETPLKFHTQLHYFLWGGSSKK